MSQSRDLKGKTLFVTGGSRGIGLAIALRAARDGANIVIAAKTAEPHPKLSGTIYTAAREIEAAGGRALPCVVDVRSEDQIAGAVAKAVETFGSIDILVNNASAISLSGTAVTPMKRFDLMHEVNVRGSFLCSKTVLPHLAKAENPHILSLAPPLKSATESRFLAPQLAYAMSKIGMSLCVAGMAEELRAHGIAVNAIWPRTLIATAAIRNLLGDDMAEKGTRSPEIVADAAHVILTRPSRDCTGNFFIDDEVLASAGITNLERYAVTPGAPLLPDMFL